MGFVLCVFLAAAASETSLPAVQEEIEEVVDFTEEEPVRRVELPEIRRRRALVFLPLLVVAGLAWNVAWTQRQRPRTRRQRSGRQG